MKDMTPEQMKSYDIKRKRAFQDMVRSEGWKYLIELLNNKLESSGRELLEPLSDVKLNAVERQEHLKGAMYGISWVRDLPLVTINARDQIHDSENPAGED